MTAEQLSTIVQSRFGERVVVSHFETKRWFMDEKTQQTWREHLMATSKRRLACAREFGGTVDSVIKETESFLGHLEHFAPEQSLLSFSATSNTTYYAGWMIDGKIVHCIPTKKEEQSPTRPPENNARDVT